MDRTEKREFVAELSSVFAETSMVVVTRNTGMTVAEATDLRRKMREAGASFKVAKNRLALLALDGTRFDGIAPAAEGARPRSPGRMTRWRWQRLLSSSPRPMTSLCCSAAALGSQVLDADGVKALAELPSLDALRAKILGMINAPATKVAGVLQAPAGQLARVFAAYADSQKSEAA